MARNNEEEPMSTPETAPEVDTVPAHLEPESIPGVTVDKTKFVVLASRLGRKMEPLPKLDPNDPTETTKYFVPDPFERGEIIELKDLWQDPTKKMNNIERLLSQGAIGFLNHREAIEARTALETRRAQEERVLRDRGVVAR